LNRTSDPIMKHPQTISGLRVFNPRPAEMVAVCCSATKDAGSKPNAHRLAISSQSAVTSDQTTMGLSEAVVRRGSSAVTRFIRQGCGSGINVSTRDLDCGSSIDGDVSFSRIGR
jgi:hypothetical protein